MNESILKPLAFFFFGFLYIYSPPFKIFPVNVSLFLALFAYAYLFYTWKIPQVVAAFKVELLLLFLICIYSLMVSIYASGTAFVDAFILLFFNVPVCIWLFYLLRDSKFSSNVAYDKLIVSLAFLAAFSAVISIALWLNKDVGEYVKFGLLKYDRDLLIYQSHRAFGLSDELLFSYSLVQGCILTLTLARFGFTRSTSVLMLLVFFSIAVNARIGFIFIGVFFFLPAIWKRKSIFWLVTLLVLGFLSSILFADIKLIEFAISQFDYFYNDFIGAHEHSTLSVLFGKMFFLPENFGQFIFGSGVNIFSLKEGASDSGYVILLHYGGVVYFMSIFAFFVWCFARGVSSGYFIPIAIICFMTFFANFKGLFFAPKPGMHLFLLVYVFLVFASCSSVNNGEDIK